MSLESELHTALQQRVSEWAALKDMAPLLNYRLPTGKIADQIYITKTGEITIIEVKTTLKDSLVTSTREKYRPYCHKLWIAAPENEVEKITSVDPGYYWPGSTDIVGVLAVGPRSVTIKQEASYKPMTKDAADYLKWHIRERERFRDQNYTITPVTEVSARG